MLTLNVKVGDALTIEGVGTVRVDHKSGKQVRLAIDVPEKFSVELTRKPAKDGPRSLR